MLALQTDSSTVVIPSEWVPLEEGSHRLIHKRPFAFMTLHRYDMKQPNKQIFPFVNLLNFHCTHYFLSEIHWLIVFILIKRMGNKRDQCVWHKIIINTRKEKQNDCNMLNYTFLYDTRIFAVYTRFKYVSVKNKDICHMNFLPAAFHS